MAVVKKWVNSSVEAGKKGNPASVMSGRPFSFATTFEVAAADDDGSVFYLAKVGANMIPLSLELNCDAIAGATDYEMGFYKEDGVAADIDILMGSEDIHAGAAIGSEINCLQDMGIENIGKKVYELLGLTAATRSQDAYILALTANTVGTAAGTISVRGTFIQG